jgi:hypothetical protein
MTEMTGAVGHSGILLLATAVFQASVVAMVEALTIVLAVGFTRGWRSVLEGAVTALAVLVALVALAGPVPGPTGVPAAGGVPRG